MIIDLVDVALDQKPKLYNLMQQYLRELDDVTGEHKNRGKLGNPSRYFDQYWRESGRHPLFIRLGKDWAGFILVRAVAHQSFEMAEFCVLPSYRRQGIGSCAAQKVFHRFGGRWRISHHEANRSAHAFWRVVVEDVSGGAYRLGWSEQRPRGPEFSFTVPDAGESHAG